MMYCAFDSCESTLETSLHLASGGFKGRLATVERAVHHGDANAVTRSVVPHPRPGHSGAHRPRLTGRSRARARHGRGGDGCRFGERHRRGRVGCAPLLLESPMLQECGEAEEEDPKVPQTRFWHEPWLPGVGKNVRPRWNAGRQAWRHAWWHAGRHARRHARWHAWRHAWRHARRHARWHARRHAWRHTRRNAQWHG